ncbi:MAG: serine/threonine-protein kinase [Acidimicrobiales bacterium]
MSPAAERLGRYRLGAVIGTGAFATVYRAHDDRLDSDVAIKVLAENHAFDADLRERFVLEGQLLRRMASPHILTVHDIGENDRAQPFLVLELADRGDLRSRVRAARAAGRSATPDEVGRVCLALASAMEVLHAAEVVHRDLAPGNLLLASPDAESAGEVRGAGILADDERVVVGDLGLSKDLARASGLTVGTGTAGFTPPEQRTAGGWVDVRADIWSASALLVWLVTGDAPDEDQAWRSHMVDGGWPSPLVDALGHGLEPDPAGRPGGASAWRAEVEAALIPVPVPAAAASEPATNEPRRPTRRLRLLSGAALAVLLLVGAALGGRVLGDGGGSQGSRTDLSGGRARVVDSANGIRLAVTGPRTAKVGEALRFSAEVDGTGRAYWITADGRSYPSTSQVEITPRSVGRSSIVLVARDDRGRVVNARFDFDVRR